MSTSNVLRFEDYRGRRAQRLRIAESLYGASESHLALLKHVAECAAIMGADRVAIVWVDEYGPGLVHPHVVLDLRSDRPRRSFAAEPLRRAWELGVPGALDEPGTSTLPSSLAIALGSDGTRAWFLAAESAAPRAMLDKEARERIMFHAGECSAVVLHRDLDATEAEHGEAGSSERRFAGWPILKDIEGREANEGVSRKISQRFAVVRLVRMLIDDDLTLPADRVAEQVSSVRGEIAAAGFDECAEVGLWHQVLDAFEAIRFDELAVALTDLGAEVEARGHQHGALELYACAYDIATATGLPSQSIEAARFSGRVLRRLARWDESRDWYMLAKDVALTVGDQSGAAWVLTGLALIHRERGNLPAARAQLADALELAMAGDDPSAEAPIYLELSTLASLSDELPLALEYGWQAVTATQEESYRVVCLAVLGGALAEAGEWSAAEDAWTVVAHESRETYYQIYAWDALAYLAAQRGDESGFELRAARCDALGWENGQRTAAAEILYYRGLSYRALGRWKEASEWLTRAVRFAEDAGLNRSLFLAEEALKSLDTPERIPAPAPAIATSAALRIGLKEMRAEAVGTEA